MTIYLLRNGPCLLYEALARYFFKRKRVQFPEKVKMHKLKFLKVQFDTEIAPYELPAFRGAIAAKVGKEAVLFHNHQDTRFRYGYPLIQYKCIGRQPAILCVGEGVEEIHQFFQQKSWNITLSNRELEMKIARLDMKQFTLQVWDKEFTYELRHWIALHQEAYQDYQQMESLSDKLHFLETKLCGNILSLAKGVGWQVDKEIRCKILEMGNTKWVKVKGIKLLAFNLTFRSNVFIPNFLGLGGKVSLGYGTVQEVRK
ncbi:CRISPR-associated endonuclease Cas6 [Rapidithrix thailandica]|uniref:CRISPR-associated endonuclease Cas6 n=1 Tax=Rapidithrix thailandica TaxID=413964 RepID=A0AAW9RPZ1_9BACT